MTALAICGRDALRDGGILTLQTRLAEFAPSRHRTATPIPPGRYVVLSLSSPTVLDADLSTVREIVNECGVHLMIKNEEGSDSSGEIYFGRLESASSEAGMQPNQSGAETILLAEDEDSVRHLAKMILERQGYRVLEARNGLRRCASLRRTRGPYI